MPNLAKNKDNLNNDPAVQAYLDFGVTAFLRDGSGWFPQREDLTVIPCERGFIKSSAAILFGASVVRGELSSVAKPGSHATVNKVQPQTQ